MADPKLNTVTADTDRHLQDVDEGTLGPSDDYLLHIVVLLQMLLRVLTRCITRQIQMELDQALEQLADHHTR